MWYIANDVVAQNIMTREQVEAYILPDGQGFHAMGMFKIDNPAGEIAVLEQIRNAAVTGDTSKLTDSTAVLKYVQARDWVTKGDPAGIGDWLQDYADRCSYLVNASVVKDNRFVQTWPMGYTPEEVLSYGSTLDDLLKEGFTKIIIGTEPLSYFDTLVAQWKAAGGDVCTAAMNKAYGN
jgi:putative aldouronate transport system substrate-binding protein